MHALRLQPPSTPSISEPPVDQGQVKRNFFRRVTHQATEVDGPKSETKQRVWLRGYRVIRRIAPHHRIVTTEETYTDRCSRTSIDTAWFPHKDYYYLCLGLSHHGQNGNVTYQTGQYSTWRYYGVQQLSPTLALRRCNDNGHWRLGVCDQASESKSRTSRHRWRDPHQEILQSKSSESTKFQ